MADLKVCARCRHWTPIYEGELGYWEDPGACRGLTGEQARWNGMWTKAGDGCPNWMLSPLRAGVQIELPIDESYEEMRIDGEPVPF